jgi:hypothetical protein
MMASRDDAGSSGQALMTTVRSWLIAADIVETAPDCAALNLEECEFLDDL